MKLESMNAKAQMAAALQRWEGEGGALITKELQILECLGAAVVSAWNELPVDAQRIIFNHVALAETYDAARIKAQVARFLHDHKDGVTAH